jgi:predicted GTPase
MEPTFNCVIIGAAGRDFHDFQTFFRNNPMFRVCAFTATQIPFIESRLFPQSLAGANYEEDIPIFPESQLPELIERFDVDFVFLAYSDLPHAEVMHKASLVQSCGAAFSMLGPKQTQLESSRPVIAITATRTGAGKSPIAQYLAKCLMENGYHIGVMRHPMPYGDLSRQLVQRFATADDFDLHNCTVEEREEYEPYVENGMTIFAGVDYAAVLTAAEAESDVILWDGGNNDYSFIRPTLSIVVADALRPGHETQFYPGETNFRAADVIVINKVDRADNVAITTIKENARRLNPAASILTADLVIDVDDPDAIAGKRVLVVEDGPTVTHGGMSFGAATVAVRKFNPAEIIDPRSFAVGSIADVFSEYPHLEAVLPALGYSDQQRQELAETIRRCEPDVVVDGSPANLSRWLDEIPVVRVRYRFEQRSGRPLEEFVMECLPPTEKPN